LVQVQQNFLICQWRADQLFAKAEGCGKQLISDTQTNNDILELFHERALDMSWL